MYLWILTYTHICTNASSCVVIDDHQNHTVAIHLPPLPICQIKWHRSGFTVKAIQAPGFVVRWALCAQALGTHCHQICLLVVCWIDSSSLGSLDYRVFMMLNNQQLCHSSEEEPVCTVENGNVVMWFRKWELKSKKVACSHHHTNE